MDIVTSTDRVTGTMKTVAKIDGTRTIMAIGRRTPGLAMRRDGDGMLAIVRGPRRFAKGSKTVARRFFWRVRHNYGRDWSMMTYRQIAKEMRMVSNRRA